MQITVGQYLFRFLLAKWAGAFVMGLWVMLAALAARRAAAGWGGGAGGAAGHVRHPGGHPRHRAAERRQIRKPGQPSANQRAVGQLPQSLLVRPPHRAAAGGVDGGSFVRRGVFGGFLPGVCQSAAAAGGKAQLCAAAGAQNPPHHRPPGGSPQAAGDRRRGSVPGRVFGLWHLPGRDVRELHRRRGDLLRPLHERRLRPLHPRELRLAGRTGRGVRPHAGGPAPGGRGSFKLRRDAGLHGPAAKVQRLPGGDRPEHQHLPERAPRRLAGV